MFSCDEFSAQGTRLILEGLHSFLWKEKVEILLLEPQCPNRASLAFRARKRAAAPSPTWLQGVVHRGGVHCPPGHLSSGAQTPGRRD